MLLKFCDFYLKKYKYNIDNKVYTVQITVENTNNLMRTYSNNFKSHIESILNNNQNKQYSTNLYNYNILLQRSKVLDSVEYKMISQIEIDPKDRLPKFDTSKAEEFAQTLLKTTKRRIKNDRRRSNK